ncbi:MlaD family protein [Roseateles cellulosilyticus]|uniref:MlaD family protein n=1 Tax=Pelomonas cellulosilytica TaxID=2906762 RepID=A0ABS8XS76_9BURK|nr:MlaD family protein [Pelomonas sp. P8]MCE4555559.1 MlaD family protein [Pelomonas sp. P8]
MKRRRANPFAIGAFVVAGIAALATALIALPGRHWFDQPQKVVMFFSGSVFGLQKGAPVVFRGVRVGSVTDISVRYETKTDTFAIPVMAQLDDDAVRGLEGRFSHDDIGHALPVLIKRGLTAQLGTQSLLTGQLYVDLDFRSKPPGIVHGGEHGDATEIPTSATAFQALKNQLESVDLRKVLDDLSQIANSTRSLVAAPELKQGLRDFAATAAHARALAAQLERRAAPLTRGAERAMSSVDRAGERVSGAADKLGSSADRAGRLLDPDGPLVPDVQRTLAELQRASSSLREAADRDGPLLQQTDRTLQDLSQAARALRRLADTLDAQPEALLRGRKPDAPLPESRR